MHLFGTAKRQGDGTGRKLLPPGTSPGARVPAGADRSRRRWRPVLLAGSAAVTVAAAAVAVTSTAAQATSTNSTDTTVVSVPVDTTPSSSSILVGQQITDYASVAVNTADSAALAGASVQFSTCGPLATAPAAGACTTATGSTDLGGAVLLVASPNGTNTLVATSTPFTPSQLGSYCFGATVVAAATTGTAIRRPHTSTNTTSTTVVGDECFTVISGVPNPNPVTHLGAATVVTTPAAPSIGLGSSNTDTATVSSSSAVPTGSVTFTICGPTAQAAACASGAGDATGLGAVTVSADPSAGADTAAATSADFTPPSTGTYCYLAQYGGDGTLAAASDGSPPSECFTVTATPLVDPGFVTTLLSAPALSLGASARDSAVVSGNRGVPTGSVTFSICKETATSTPCSGGTQLATVATATATSTTTATYDLPAADAYRPTSAGSWCFSAFYSGDATYAPMAAETDPAAECFAVVAPAVAAKSGKSGSAPEAVTTLPVTSATGGAITGATTVHTGMWWAGSTPWVIGSIAGGLALVGLGRYRRSQRRLALARHRIRSH